MNCSLYFTFIFIYFRHSTKLQDAPYYTLTCAKLEFQQLSRRERSTPIQLILQPLHLWQTCHPQKSMRLFTRYQIMNCSLYFTFIFIYFRHSTKLQDAPYYTLTCAKLEFQQLSIRERSTPIQLILQPLHLWQTCHPQESMRLQ